MKKSVGCIMNNKVIVTGGSGFIGTNLISSLIIDGFDVINIDIAEPTNVEHSSVFYRCDIRNLDELERIFQDFNPDFVVHLAARTDLDGCSLDDYDSNTVGVENICTVISKNHGVKRVLFASSMLVCSSGYQPKNNMDFFPNTIYGESKVYGEKYVSECSDSLPDFYIVRPTSIWGPWFNEPYRHFFDLVLSGRFLDIGDRYCSKTYGYVGNSVNQIKSLLFHSKKNKGEVFYIGDMPPLQISHWAHLISEIAGIGKPKKIPYFILLGAAYFGDFLGLLCRVRFPMTTFRLRNMTTNNIIDCQSICDENQYPHISLEDSITTTLNWIAKRDKK